MTFHSVVYIDYILIFSPDKDTHAQNLCQVFELLCLHGLNISLPKCVLAISELEFLGHNLSSSSCCSTLDKQTSSLSSFPLPSDKPAIQRFLEMLEFLQEIYQECSVNSGPPHQCPQGRWQTVRLDSTPGCSFLPCPFLCILSLVLPSSRCLRYTRWWSSPAMCATVLVPPRLLLQEAVQQ